LQISSGKKLKQALTIGIVDGSNEAIKGDFKSIVTFEPENSELRYLGEN
jgi:hypothetical protein